MRTCSLGIVLVGPALLSLGCQSPRSGAAAAEPSAAPSVAAATRPAPPARATPALAECQPTRALEDRVKRLTEAADTNGDGQISRKEANGLASFLVGGFFFRADENHDFVITPAEGRETRKEFRDQYPELALLLRQAKTATASDPIASLARLLDVDYGQSLSADDARAAAQRAVDDLFGAADANHDQSISAAEARAAGARGMQALGAAAFAAADENRDDKLSLSEFQHAVETPLKVAFQAADRNQNGVLSEDEAARAMDGLARHLGVPEPTKTQ